jgi:formyltetrahydrofolate-dependent phosphoribosylglycinamide formyltransferase
MSPRLVVLVSGSGTNLQAILDSTAQRRLRAEVVLVVSNRKAAHALVRAEQAGVPTLHFPLKAYTDGGRSRESYDAALADKVSASRPDLVVLAGWMHVLSAAFLDRFPGRVINLHPALPGKFPGTNGIQRTYEAFRRGEVTEGGCMIHYVVPEVDAGSVIIQATVPIWPADTPETFEARMHATEHRLIVEGIRLALDEIAHKETT